MTPLEKVIAGRCGVEGDRGEGRRKKWRIRECCADSTLDKNRLIAKLPNTLATSLQTLAWADIAGNKHEFKVVTLACESLKAD